jgi:hypothetical protein
MIGCSSLGTFSDRSRNSISTGVLRGEIRAVWSSGRAFDAKGNQVAEQKSGHDNVGHVQDFLDCMRSRERPVADLETVGHPNVARTLESDHAAVDFITIDVCRLLAPGKVDRKRIRELAVQAIGTE